jgi:hypothetical protein
MRVTDLLVDAIQPDDTQGEPPLLPILNRHRPTGSTDSVDLNRWGRLRKWQFHVCRDPQMISKEIDLISRRHNERTTSGAATALA